VSYDRPMDRIIDVKRMPGPEGATNVLAAPIDFDTAPKTVGPFAIVAHHTTVPIPAGALPVDADVRPHPHIGLAAISVLLEGAITHRDSLGNRCELVAGDIGVTIGGNGVVHSERLDRIRVLGGAMDMMQILLALPDGLENVEPAFFRVAAAEMPTTRGGGASVRWLAPTPPAVPLAPWPTTTPILLSDVAFDAGASWSLPDVPERALYVRAGEIEVRGARVGAGQVAVVGPGEVLVRSSQSARLLAFGGTSVGPRYLWWNYMHSSLDRIEAAKTEWRAGRVKLPPGDTESFTPAPADNGRPLIRLNAG
jgi:redox-sensitive bicupin YhaK (pirin superfamily)